MKDYKEIWNNLSTTFADASFYVCCIGDEDQIRSNGALTAEFLQSVLQIEPTDKVLEIGCGVARIGRELAPSCGEWHGCDISGNMIEYARQRTADIPNIYLHELPDNNLSIFPDNYFDCVYCTIVFMHLDKPDLFIYLREAHRVLKPGGRAYFDTYNILAPEAWQEFSKILKDYRTGRPGHVSQFSTPQEMQKFMDEAGFDMVHIDAQNPQLVVALGRKSQQSLSIYRGAQDGQPVLVREHAAAQGPNGPSAANQPAVAARPQADQVAHEDLLSRQQVALQERLEYIKHLEAEVARKDKALADLTARYRRRERELVTARKPRLPWKRR